MVSDLFFSHFKIGFGPPNIDPLQGVLPIWAIKTWGDQRTYSRRSETVVFCFGPSIFEYIWMHLPKRNWLVSCLSPNHLAPNDLVLLWSGPRCVRQRMQAVSAICKELESLCLRVSLAAQHSKERTLKQWTTVVPSSEHVLWSICRTPPGVAASPQGLNL